MIVLKISDIILIAAIIAVFVLIVWPIIQFVR